MKPTAGFIGVVLVMTEHITGSLRWFVTRVSDCEQPMVSIERINQYSKSDFPQEKSVLQCIEHDQTLKQNWPSTGIIEVKNVYMRYRVGTPLVLNGLTFSARSGERIGIVGRTGVGKSSLFRVLLRLVEVEQ